jgi:hypothetical protein
MGARCSKLSLCFWASNIKSSLNDLSDIGEIFFHFPEIIRLFCNLCEFLGFDFWRCGCRERGKRWQGCVAWV